MNPTIECGCGCGFPIIPGMTVYLISGNPYTLGCVGAPVLVTQDGPDTRKPMDYYGRGNK